jgi:arylsulfatase A-like enzyme
VRILYLDLDTLRPDHLSCYGYHRPTTPNLDRIAKEGVRFDNHYCSDAPCLPSRTALMTGRFGIHTGVVGHDKTSADHRLDGVPRGFRSPLQESCLPAIFRRQRMRTTLISPFAERHSAWPFYAGFTEMHNTGLGGQEIADDVTPTALDWIRRNARTDDWYLHINYWDPHTAYRAPMSFGHPFADSPPPAWLTPELLAQHQRLVGPHTARDVNMYDDFVDPRYPRSVGAIRTMADWRRHIDGYDTCINYLDTHIGRLFDALTDAGVFDDLAVIISSDHGENQGELGIYAEHGTADHGTCRIPMIVRWPGCQRGTVDAGLHHNLDLAPTLADLFGQKPQPIWDGRSFAPALRQGTDCGKPYLVISQCAHVCQRGVRFGDHLYIRTYHDGFHLFPREMLFDVVHDPHEIIDLAPTRPDLCHEANWYLSEWHDTMMASMPDAVDPLWTVIREGGPCHAPSRRLEPYLQRLAATDRAWGVEELRRRHRI